MGAGLCFRQGVANRAHAYKAEREACLDAGINAGVFNYPRLMAADIPSFQAGLMPVGWDQRQHVEIARNVAAAFNRSFGPIFTPSPATDIDVGGSLEFWGP